MTKEQEQVLFKEKLDKYNELNEQKKWLQKDIDKMKEFLFDNFYNQKLLDKNVIWSVNEKEVEVIKWNEEYINEKIQEGVLDLKKIYIKTKQIRQTITKKKLEK